MSIEQRNTLFVLGLVVLVLGGAALIGYVLVADHVERQMQRDLMLAVQVHEAQERRARARLTAAGRSLAAEPALLAAALTDDVPTVASMLDDLLGRAAVDLIAVYIESGQAGVGRRPHYASPQVLASEPFLRLVRGLGRPGGGPAATSALVFNEVLRLVAVPLHGPTGGRIGAVVVGEVLTAERVRALAAVTRTEAAVFVGNVVVGSTLPAEALPLERLAAMADGGADASGAFTVAGERYRGRIVPLVPTGDAHLLLALSEDAQWAPYRALAVRGAAAALVILLLAAGIGLWVSRASLTRPLRELAAAVRAIGAGDLTVEVEARRGDELGELARAFNRMLTSLASSRAELEESRQRFHDFAAASSDWLWETDRNGVFTYVSPSVSESLGYSAADLVGHTLEQVFRGDEVGEVMSVLRPARGVPQPFKELEVWLTSADGHRRCLRMNGVPVRRGEAFMGYRGTARDITKAKQDESRLVTLANQDPLTGLANRRRFLGDLAHELRRAERTGRGGALMLLDLDHIKLINDTAGHAAGDEVIVQVAGVLRRLSRGEDLLARLSGDEFALAFAGMGAEQAMDKAHEILERIASLKPMFGGRMMGISASIGVVLFPEHGTEPVELLAKADTAMYAAKDAGRNRAHLYSEEDHARELMDSQLTWKERIQRALEEDLLELVYQPIAPAAGGPPARYEVLVRMRGPGGKRYGPGAFIPTAEQFGLIRQVDRVIVSKALARLAELQRAGVDVSFSINLSGLSVGDAAMLDFIRSEIAAAGVDQRRVIFELTETAACENLAGALEFIRGIRQLGCKVSLDDFGVGFSSFSYLRNLRVDGIKIDGSFIREIHRNREDQLFVKAIVDVAAGMQIQTTAEYVENAEILAMVRSLGVDYVQGYYIGRPKASLQGMQPRAAP